MSFELELELASGAEGRWTNVPTRRALVCVNGGTAADVPGTWSSSVEWLVRRLAPRFPELGFLEVRYRTKSWRRLELCIEDARSALDAARAAGAVELALLGYSMGGAVAVHVAAEPAVRTVIALAPWLYPQLDLGTLRDRRLAIVHGSMDRGLPGIPGVKPALSLAGYTRARALRIDAVRTVIPLASHAIALRRRSGGLLALPRAARWEELVAEELERFCA